MSEPKNCMVLYTGRKEFVWITERKRITKEVACQFIDFLAEVNHLCEELVVRAKADTAVIKAIQNDILHATIEEKDGWWQITGKNFQENYDFNKEYLYIFEELGLKAR